jgi:hypothetical protein
MPKMRKTGKINTFERLRFLASPISSGKIVRFGHLVKYYLAKTPK